MTSRHDGPECRQDTRFPLWERTSIDLSRPTDTNPRPIFSATLRSLAFIVIAMLLIVVLLPAAIVAAGT
jgi:hypothetical protein